MREKNRDTKTLTHTHQQKTETKSKDESDKRVNPPPIAAYERLGGPSDSEVDLQFLGKAATLLTTEGAASISMKLKYYANSVFRRQATNNR